MNERNEPDPSPEKKPSPQGDQAVPPSHGAAGMGAGTEPQSNASKGKPQESPGASGGTSGGSSAKGAPTDPAEQAKRRRRRRRPPQDSGLERISQVHYCRTNAEANQYLALGPEWDLQDIIPMRVETEDGGERDEVHFVVARWENERDRARLRKRDRRGVPRRRRE